MRKFLNPAWFSLTWVFIVNSLLAFQESNPRALITDIKGQVMIKKNQKTDFIGATWGMQLYEGDRLKTLAASEVAILFANNNLITLGQNSTITVSEGPGTLRNNTQVKTDAALFADLFSLALHKTSDGEIGALAGLRSGSPAYYVELQSPRNAKIRSNRPDFKWSSRGDFDRFTVKLFDKNGLVWSRQVSKTKLDFPAAEKPLGEDTSYFWQVEGEGLFETSKSSSVEFAVLSQSECEEIKLQEKKIEELFKVKQSSSYCFALGALYKKMGLLEDAIKQFEIIAQIHSDVALPYEILGGLYSTIGLKDKAIVALQTAVKLSRKE